MSLAPERSEIAPSESETIRAAIDEIWKAGEQMQLDPFPIHFEIVPPAIMYQIGSYGLPGRFSHWTHGKAFHQMKTMYDYGLSKIYELIINSDPAQAFLMEGNSLIQNKLVVAHVIGHSDFFKNNAYFQHTSRQMAETAGVNAERIRSYEFHHGQQAVEEFLDAVLAIQEHIDPNLRVRRRDSEGEDEERRPGTRRRTDYDDLWKLGETAEEPTAARRRLPEEPEKDLLLFLLECAPDLDEWQRDIISIVRHEMLYFMPQMQTKLMNEGWASYWHARMLREMDITPEEHLEFTRLHASVLSPSPRGTSINPYYVGFKMLEDIERRWNGDLTEEERREYSEQNGGREWPHSGQGREKLFEVRETENDVSFVRNYLTRQLVEEMDLYIYRREGDQWVIAEKDWRKVRDALVEGMTNFGFPYIVVEDGDYRRNRELYLVHRFDGRDLDVNYCQKTLRLVYRLWSRPVHLETVVDEKKTVFCFDGEIDEIREIE